MEPPGINAPDLSAVTVPPLTESTGSEQQCCPPAFITIVDRWWKAEEVNATRIAARGNLVLTGVTAVLGLKLYGAGKEIDTIINAGFTWRSVLCGALALLAFGGLIWCLKIVLEVRIKRTSTNHAGAPACRLLQLSAEQVEAPWRTEPGGAEVVAFKNTYAAALELHLRNKERNRAIGRSQSLFFISVLVLFATLFVYASVAFENAARESARLQELLRSLPAPTSTGPRGPVQ